MAPPSENDSSDSNSESDRHPARRRYSQRRTTAEEAWLAPEEPPEQGPDGSYIRPPGRAPVNGYNWSSTRGVWVPGKRLLDEMQLSRHQTVRRRAPVPHRQQRATSKGDSEAVVKPKRKNRKRSAIAEEISSDFEDFSEAPSSSAGGGTARGRKTGGRTAGKRSAPPVAQVNFRTGDGDISTGSRKRAKAPPTTAAASSSHASSAASSLKSPPPVDAPVLAKSPPPPPDVPEDPYHPDSMWKEPKPGPLESDLTLYEKQRKPRPAPQGRFQCPVSLLKQEFRCVICLDYMTNARIVRECLHRFCEGCIEKSLVQGRKECPICRVHIPSRRSLAPDPDFDTLIRHIVKDNQGHHDDHDVHSDEERPALTRASRILQRAIRKRLSRQNKASGVEDDDEDEDEDVTTSEEEETDRKVVAAPEDEPAIGDATAPENKEEATASDGPAPSSPPESKPDQPSLIKVVLIRLRKERTVMDDLQMPFLTLSDDAPVSVLQQFLRQKHGFRFPNFDILLYHKNCGGNPICAPSHLSLREFVSTYSSRFVLDNAAGYLPLYYRVQRRE